MPWRAERRLPTKPSAILLVIGVSLCLGTASGANEPGRAGKAMITGAPTTPAGAVEQSADMLLVMAIRQQDMRAVDRLLSEGADPNAYRHGDLEPLEQEGRLPPLFEAALTDNEAILATLIDAGAEIDLARQTDASSFHTPLSFAALHGSHVAASLLMDHGARPGGPACMEDHCGNAMTMAAIGGNGAIVRALADASIPGERDELIGLHGLISEFEAGSPDSGPGFDTRLLDNRASGDFLPPAIAAARFGHAEIVAQLLRLGTDVDQANTAGLTALIAAVEFADLRTVRLLLAAGADPNAGEIRFDDRWATRFESIYGREPTRLELGSGLRPIHVAVATGNPELVRTLLEAGADMHATYAAENRWPQTTLNQAIAVGERAIVQELLDRGAHPDRAAGTGLYPLVVAVEQGSADLVRLLLAEGADPDKSEYSPLRGDNAKPIHLAVRDGRVDLLRILLEAGADVNATHFDEGDGTLTTLGHAVENGNLELVRFLIDSGADTGRSHGGGGDAVRETYLETAARLGFVELVHLFAAAGNPVDRPEEELRGFYDFGGRTPLMIAAQYGRSEVLAALIEEYGVPVSKRNSLGCTAIDFAVLMEQPDAERVLRTAGAEPDPAACQRYRSP